MITADSKEIINKIIKNSNSRTELKNSELELEFDLNRDKMSIDYEIYVKLVKYINYLAISAKKQFTRSCVIDCSNSIVSDKIINNRITIPESLIESCKKQFAVLDNARIFWELLTLKEKDITYIRKIRSSKDVHDFPNINVRFRKSIEHTLTIAEKDVLAKKFHAFIRGKNDNECKVSFRMKNRISLEIDGIRIDLTESKSSYNFNFDNKPSNYELELEVNKINYDVINKYISRFLKVIQQSNIIITTNEINTVNSVYNDLFNKPKETINKRIDAMNVVSLEIKHLDNIENNYAITDKADGEHSFLLITNNNVYLITQYFHIKNLGLKVNKEFNNCIFDGEYVFVKGKYLFMGFDCLFYCGKDMRSESSLIKRMECLNEFCKKNFSISGLTYLDNDKAKDIDVVVKYYQKELLDFVNGIMKDKSQIIIRPKFFMKVYGLANNEIYYYSKLFWNTYNELIKSGNYPYHLDGLVYQPLNQTYSLKSELQIYKWKPYYQNSIDFYLTFDKDDKGNDIIAYDNTIVEMNEEDGEEHNDEISADSIVKYKIGKLYVGSVNNNVETPIIFSPKLNNPDNDIHIIYIPYDGKYCRDRENNIINDNTVVEVFYDDKDENKYFRWKVIRTRYDKTENVLKYKKKYGNNSEVASNIWNSIKYPITFEHIIDMATDKHMDIKDNLRSLNSAIMKNDQYYTVDYDIRNAVNNKVLFHNMIKTMLIKTYCSPKNGKKMSVFDTGIGKGKDINNYYTAHVRSVVGMDPDYPGLHNNNGTISKYKNMIATKPNVPNMRFINADFTVDLNTAAQLNVGMDKSKGNIKLMNECFKWKYDVVSCQFAFHYFLKTEETFAIALNNLKKLLNVGGYVIMTLFDGQLVDEYLSGKDEVENYVDVKGIRTLVHKITKRYGKDKLLKEGKEEIFKCGNAIDVFVGEGGINRTEYLVDKRYLIKKMNEYGFGLVETATFEEVYNNINEYVNRIKEVETKESMKTHLMKLSGYYEDNETNKECFKITRLNRYYVFKKIGE